MENSSKVYAWKSRAGLGSLLVDPVVQTSAVSRTSHQFPYDHDSTGSTRYVPGDFNGVELHAHTKNSGVLVVFGIRAGANDGAEVVVLNLLPLVHPVAPLLLARLALHVVLDKGSSRVEVRERLHEGLVDLVVLLGQAQLGALDLLQNSPVCHEVFDG